MTLDEIKNNELFPWLIMGDAVIDFKKSYDGRINYVGNMEEMRELVAYYSAMKMLERPLVIEDISLFAKNGEGVLLKFVEETQLNLILLSRFDKVSAVLLSRVKRVDKYYKEKTESQLLKVKTGCNVYSQAVDDNTHYYDKIKKMGQISPKLLFFERKIRNRRLKDKLLQVLE